LVESVNLGITAKTLDTVVDISLDRNWELVDNDYKKTHPLILVRTRNILFTSIVLVFEKRDFRR
jgi:hypothetical protein